MSTPEENVKRPNAHKQTGVSGSQVVFQHFPATLDHFLSSEYFLECEMKTSNAHYLLLLCSQIKNNLKFQNKEVMHQQSRYISSLCISFTPDGAAE